MNVPDIYKLSLKVLVQNRDHQNMFRLFQGSSFSQVLSVLTS